MCSRRRFPVWLNVCLVALFLVGTNIAGVSQEAAVQARRTVESINNSARITLHGNTHPLAVPVNDRGPAPTTMRADRMLLVLQRSAQQEAALQTYLHAIHDANSQYYRQWLTPDEFGRRFGVSDADVATVEQWLTQQGFTVNRVTAGRIAVEFSGTFAQVENAFHTSLHQYLVNGEQHWANALDPQIPQALAPVVRGIAALHNFSPRSMAVLGPSGRFRPERNEIRPQLTQGNTTNGYMLYIGPADAATIYDTPTSMNPLHSGSGYDGTGVTIGIAGDSNIDTQQVDNYRATFGLPVKTTQVVVDGADPGENGDAVEAYLDTEVTSGIAPGADIVLYTAANTYLEPGLFLAMMRAVDNNAVDILNVSFGACEASLGTTGNQFIYNLWQQAAAQGIAVTVSTGDSGSAGCDDPNASTKASHGLAVNGLASTPYNIAVGGTDFDTLYSNFPDSFTSYVDVGNSLPNHRSALSYIPEAPWNDSTTKNGLLVNNIPWSAPPYFLPDNIIAGGGGASACVTMNGTTCSAGYPVPSWQSLTALDKSGRNLPDVSFLAGNGLYGVAWALCTDQDYISATVTQPDCLGTPTSGNNFNVTGVGGTSASAPAFAGMLALATQKTGGRLGQANYELYDLAKTKYSTVFHDTVTGNNSVFCETGTSDCIAVDLVNTYYLSGFNSRAGYDEAIGLGSVDATQMLNNWGGTGTAATSSLLTLDGSTAALTLTHGDAVSVQVNVSGSGGTPSGPVALVDNLSPASLPNGGAIDSFVLSSGSLNSMIHNLPGGSYEVSAHYGGDSAFAASDSNAISVTVNPEDSATDLKVRGYFDPMTGKQSSTPYYGYLYVLDAQPYGSSSSLSSPDGVASGTVTFQSGTTTLGSASVSGNGVAELLTGMIPGGSNSLKASFPGDSSFKASISEVVALTVQPAPTALIIVTDKEGYQAGDPVSMTATFTNGSQGKFLDSIGAAPTGTITFIADGTNTVGTAAVTGTAGSTTSLVTASATFVTKNLAAGHSHNISASYSGDGNYAAGSTASSAFIQIVNASTTVTFTQSSTNIKQNQTLDLTAVLSTSGNLPAPTGTVSFSVIKNSDYYSAWTSSNITLSNGTATVTVPADTLPLGKFTLLARYSGDNLYGQQSQTGSLTVTASGTVIPTLKLTLPNTPVNNALPITLSVTGPSGDPVPTGSITVSTSSLSWPLINGSVSFTNFYSWQPGANTITVTYLGDSIYASASATGSFTQMGLASLTVSPQSPTVYVGDPVTFTISVAQIGKLPAPTGTITISCGSYRSAVTALIAGTASITIPANSLPVGVGTLSVSYSGDANYVALSGASYPFEVTSEPAAFKLAGSNLTVRAGATTANTASIRITPAGGFTGIVNLTAQITQSPANAAYPPTLSFGNSSPANISAPNGTTATLMVSTTARTTAMRNAPSWPEGQWLGMAGGSALGCVLLVIVPRRRRWQKWLAFSAVCIALLGELSACGGSGGSTGGGSGGTIGTTAGVYTITVTGTSANSTAATTITLTVQ